ncbi:hypothetical protein Rsub_09886 [Raphidocelis subcapitata]|uniref:Uncharacterized protein n=1 Tax=Raphidocelis subcapitata TaxID=307507 RepID=A0A2V0PAJ3_9CHLO|nr:hypothetical protein Rsub_09886 [Raphidocelis subcapitata]|eukprot:GBF96881.1 hypothetical protein Rsub_09886 [Raphidocelis subcapitata]
MDRVAELSLMDAPKAAPHKRRAGREASQQKRGSGTKVARTDSGSDGGSMMDVCGAQTSDSAQSSSQTSDLAPQPPAAAAAAPQPQPRARAAAGGAAAQPDAGEPGAAEAPGPGGADGPDAGCCDAGGAVADEYIKGTRLRIGGWFQACRGCSEPTAHTFGITGRDVPLCPRCQTKYSGMVSGEYPRNVGAVDGRIEPLCYWLPRMLGSMPRMADSARREFCDQLVLRQDDAWRALIRSSSDGSGGGAGAAAGATA